MLCTERLSTRLATRFLASITKTEITNGKHVETITPEIIDNTTRNKGSKRKEIDLKIEEIDNIEEENQSFCASRSIENDINGKYFDKNVELSKNESN